ncbi:cupin domain-containing protein [Kosakonia sp. H02]|nr:cupin domain-containing protein [Kosakonia sp. H02]
MRKSSRLLISLKLVIISVISFFSEAQANNNQDGIIIEKLSETAKSWDGVTYNRYPEGETQLTTLKITIPPYTSLSWHEHPIPNVAYVLRGRLTVEKKDTGQKMSLSTGQVLPEMVNSAHRGYTGKEGTTLIVFYAGARGIPLSKPAD